MIHVLMALLIAGAVVAKPPAYRVEGLAPDSAQSGDALAVNANGDAAGRIDGAAFTWTNGHATLYAGYRYSYLDGTYTATANAINKGGVAVGSDGSYMPCSMSGLELATATRYEDGKMSFVDRGRVGQCSFEVNGINDAGVMVGISGFRGFVRYPSGLELEIKPLSRRPVDNGTRASAIDNEGDVVGGSTIDVKRVRIIQQGEMQAVGGPLEPMYGPDPDSYVIHAFLASFAGGRQRMRDLGGLPRFPDTYATAVAEDGTVVGYSGTHSGPKWTRVSGPSHAWMWYRGRMTDLGGASSLDSFAYGVNDRGVVVGCEGSDAVRWVDKHMQRLDDLIGASSGWHLECARAINRSGVIVGTGYYSGKHLPFRLVPTRITQRDLR